MLLYEGGCCNCGSQNTFPKQKRVFLKREDGHEVVVGICDNCFDTTEFDINVLKKNLIDSERGFAAKNGKSDAFANKLEQMTFTSYRKCGKL